jgi:hypothetical protein
MKKGIIVLFIISTFFPCIANATYHLNYFAVYNEMYENGTQLNRLAFTVVDTNNQYPSTDVMDSVVLTDPNGKNVVITITVPKVYNTLEENGYYDTTKLEWIYPPFYHYFWYGTEFSDQIISGTYHLTFTDKNGEISKRDFVINKIVNLPNIPSSSYIYYRDQDGNFIWHWQLPIDPNIQSVKAQIKAYGEQGNNLDYLGEVFVSIPTNMAWVLVPKNIFDQVLSMGKTLKLVTQTRTNDNNNRSYSNEVPINISQIPTGTACTSTLNANLQLQIPYLSYDNGALRLWADFVYNPDPSYPTLIPFKLTNYAVINNPSFTCSPSTLSNDFKIHIPDVLLPDGITRLWVDLTYNPALSTDGNFYWVVSNFGTVSN